MENIFKQNTVYAIVFELQLINLKVAIAQLYNEVQVCNFTIL